MNNQRKWFLRVGLLFVVVFLYLVVEPVRSYIHRLIALFSTLDVEAIKSYILSFGIWAPVISFLLMMFQSVAAPLPAFLITFANAALFGWWKGAILSWSGAMAGAVLCFFIGRLYGRDVVEKLVSRLALESIDRFFERHGQYAILIARLLPFVSFDVVSYAAGLTSMTFWAFFWATGLGQLPATIVYSIVGDMLVGSVKTVVFGLLILFSLTVFAILLKRIFAEKNTEPLPKQVSE